MSGECNCPTCGLGVPSGFSYCPRCRAKAEGRDYDPGEVDGHERHYVFTLVALSLGAVAIPRLLKSRSFSGGEKAGLGLLGVVNTSAVLVIGYYFFLVWFPAYVQFITDKLR